MLCPFQYRHRYILLSTTRPFQTRALSSTITTSHQEPVCFRPATTQILIEHVILSVEEEFHGTRYQSGSFFLKPGTQGTRDWE